MNVKLNQEMRNIKCRKWTRIPFLLYTATSKTRKSRQVILIIIISCKCIAHN